jgi:urease accessory protein UreF
LLLSQLQLIHLAGSGLPIGSAAHTFGLETLVADGALSVETLEDFFTDYLLEMGQAEAVFCRAGYEGENVTQLNARFSAMRIACAASRPEAARTQPFATMYP